MYSDQVTTSATSAARSLSPTRPDTIVSPPLRQRRPTGGRPRKICSLSKSAVEERRLQYKVKEEEYKRWTSELQAKGYSDDQTNKIILRPCARNSIEALISLHKGMYSAGFTHDDLTIIAANSGGSNNLEALIGYWKKLQPAEQKPALRRELVRVVAHGGGSNNLTALIDYWEKLTEAEQTSELRQELVRVVAHAGGSKSLATLIDYWKKLPEAEQTSELRRELVRVVAHSGGSKSLTTLIDYWEKLPKAEQTSGLRQELVRVVACDGGSKSLAALIDYWEKLPEAEQTSELRRGLVRIASCNCECPFFEQALGKGSSLGKRSSSSALGAAKHAKQARQEGSITDSSLSFFSPPMPSAGAVATGDSQPTSPVIGDDRRGVPGVLDPLDPFDPFDPFDPLDPFNPFVPADPATPSGLRELGTLEQDSTMSVHDLRPIDANRHSL